MDDNLAYRTIELAEIYDAVYASVDDAAFWRGIAEGAVAGPPLLSWDAGRVGCLIPLARAAFEITGLDLSAPDARVFCRDKLRR